MMRTSWAGTGLRLLLGVVVVAGLAACGSGSDGVLSGAGESCTKTGDCESGLKCVNLVCQLAGADCPGEKDCAIWKDSTSGLTWQVSPPTDHYTWDEAKSYCGLLSLGGHSDWRLPTIGELRTLIRGCPGPESGGACNVEDGDCLARSCWDKSCEGCDYRDGPGQGGMYWPHEVGYECCCYWSSSPVEDHDDNAWLACFVFGDVRSDDVGVDVNVRCVR